MFEYLKKCFLHNDQKNQESSENPSVSEHVDALYENLLSDALLLNIGDDLATFIVEIEDKLWALRDELFEKNGFVLPPVRILQDNTLQENEYKLFVQGKYYDSGYTLFDSKRASDEIINSLRMLCKKNIEKVFTNKSAEKCIDLVQKNNSWLVWNLTNAMPVWGIRLVLVSLLKEGKSIKNIDCIFEKMCKYATKNREINYKPDPYLVCKNVCKDMN